MPMRVACVVPGSASFARKWELTDALPSRICESGDSALSGGVRVTFLQMSMLLHTSPAQPVAFTKHPKRLVTLDRSKGM